MTDEVNEVTQVELLEEKPAWRSKRTLLAFLVSVFVVSSLFQGIQLREFDMTDSGIWGHEAEYVLHRDPRALNFLENYAHPGGPIIEGTIILNALFDFPYDTSVLIFVTLFNSLVIAGVCALAITLRRRSPWWIAVLGILSLNRLYDFATPPSAVATVLVVFLCLLTLYIFENKEKTRSMYLLFWGLVSGLAVATRADIGIFSSAAFLALVLPSIGWRKAILLIGEAMLVFTVFDPFMWYMPVQHVKDLIFAVVFHYASFAPNHVSITSFAISSSLALMSVFLSIQFLLLRKKITPPLPPLFIGVLLFMTGVLCTILFTSHYQAVRYFLPILFIWEIFLPLFIFTLIDNVQFPFGKNMTYQLLAKKTSQWFVIVLIFFYHLSSLVLALFIADAFHVLPPWPPW